MQVAALGLDHKLRTLVRSDNGKTGSLRPKPGPDYGPHNRLIKSVYADKLIV